MKENKLFLGILLGAAVGGVVAMFDKSTRKIVVDNLQKAKSEVTYYSKNTEELKDIIGSKVENAQNLYNKISSEAEYYVQKFTDIQESTPGVKSLMENTKEAFTKEDRKKMNN